MNNRDVNISLLSYLLWIVIYNLYGNPDSTVWSSIFYMIESGFSILILFFVRREIPSIKDWFIFTLVWVFVVRFVYNLLILFNEQIGVLVDKKIYSTIVITGVIFICLIINCYNDDKKH